MNIEYIPVQELQPFVGNARTHSRKQIRQIAKSIERFGFCNPCAVFNLYKPATLQPNAGSVQRWLDHFHLLYGDCAEHQILWLAHRVQRPHEKINHALVLGGGQGIGKDTLLEPVKRAIGPWNFCEVSPQHMLGRFNGYLKSVILRVNEARDLGDVDRFAFYDHMKAYTAAPPDVLRVDEKHLREYAVPNVTGIIITSNYKGDGIFLPPDDRRHHVGWSGRTMADFSDSHWREFYAWYETGGYEAVAYHLAHLDLSTFDAKAPPPKTAAFWDIVDANRSPEDAELADTLDVLQNPNAVTLAQIMRYASGDFEPWIKDRKNRRAVPHRLERCGYVPIRNSDASDGLWEVNGKRQVIYAKRGLNPSEQFKAAQALVQ